MTFDECIHLRDHFPIKIENAPTLQEILSVILTREAILQIKYNKQTKLNFR